LKDAKTDFELPVDSEGEDAPAEVVASVEEAGEEEKRPEIPTELNLLPLRDSVVYPMLIAPLSVSRPGSIQLIDESVAQSNRVIGVVTQREPGTEEPGFDDVFQVGCAVIVRTLVKSSDAVRLIVQGLVRFRITERLQSQPYLRARIEPLEDAAPDPSRAEEVEALRRSVAALFDQAVRLHPNLPDELRSLTSAVQEPNVMADLVAAHLPLSTADKQAVLETLDVIDRLRTLLAVLGREVRVLELSSKVQSEVSAELSKNQRDYYLREQLKAIQRELGEADDHGSDLEDLRRRIDAAGLPEEALKEVEREFDRLQRINPSSPEHTVARTYIETVTALPWSVSTEDNLDLAHVRRVLDEDHAGLDKVKQRIVEFLAVMKVKKGPVRQPILCFYGPPGVGKTSLGRSIARAMGRKFVRVSLGGVRDEAEIRGHRRTYIGALPGQIIQGLRRAGSNNPVFVLDEIDKLGSDFRGDPASALLEVLDPEQNDSFRDHYIDAPFDLSRAFFITTANRMDTVPPALRDRMEVMELAGYTEEEKLEIAKRHLVPRQIEEHGLSPRQIGFVDSALVHVVRHYTREAGVRNLEREIGSVVRRATLEFAEGRKRKLTVTSRFVTATLGAPRYVRDPVTERQLVPGMSVGLAWTPVGGDVLFIETAKFPGKGVTVTGSLGEVMRESVLTALSYLKSHAADLGLDNSAFEPVELHVHVPEGATPKDGPSAGIAMLTALASLFTGRLVKPRLAMTGEITLTGQVLPVGGVKEKCLAAHRAGVTTVILPEDNKKDYFEGVPEHVRAKLECHFVDRASQVLRLALEPRRPKPRRPRPG
jgi:ATP-dependent Lon protease